MSIGLLNGCLSAAGLQKNQTKCRCIVGSKTRTPEQSAGTSDKTNNDVFVVVMQATRCEWKRRGGTIIRWGKRYKSIQTITNQSLGNKTRPAEAVNSKNLTSYSTVLKISSSDDKIYCWSPNYLSTLHRMHSFFHQIT